MSKEIRMFVRSFAGEGKPAAAEDSRVIEGYAVVFNQRSKLVYDYNLWKPVIETITPGAITQDLINRSDVLANMEHNDRRLLARCVNGKGTLTLTIDEIGLKYRFESPNTNEGDFAYEMVKRGDIGGSSFCYWNDNDECNVTYSKTTDENGKEVILRTVNKIDHLHDVAIVLNPAYVGTSVEARSQEAEYIKKSICRAMPDLEIPDKEPTPAERAAGDLADVEAAIMEADGLCVGAYEI